MTVRTETRVLFLPDDTAEGIRVLDVWPARPFRPFAIMLWGAKPDTFIRQLRIGWEAQLARVMPGFEFESDIAFDYFRTLCIPRPDAAMPAIESLRDLGIFHRLSLPPVEMTDHVELTVEGPIEHAVIIGDVPRVVEKAA